MRLESVSGMCGIGNAQIDEREIFIKFLSRKVFTQKKKKKIDNFYIKNLASVDSSGI